MSLLIEVSKIVKLIESEGRMVFTRGWEEGGNGELLISGHKISVMQDE